MLKAGWWVAAVLTVVLVAGSVWALSEMRETEAELRSVRGELETQRETIDHVLGEQPHFKTTAAWETTPHVEAVKQRGAIECFECHEPTFCADCHTEL